mgnify:FL=1
MKLITSFNIDQSDLSALSTDRQFSIEGDQGAELILQVFNSSQQFYNFTTRSFTAAFNSENNLNVVLNNGTYNNSIAFPAASGVTYTMLLLTGSNKDTEINIGYVKNSHSVTIDQVGNSTLTFTPLSATSSNYGDMPDNITSVASPGIFSATKSLNWDLPGVLSDARGFGLRLIRQPIDTDWYFQTTEAILSNPIGDTVSNNKVVVSDLTDIGTGMELIFHKGTTAPAATTVITAIDLTTKTITFSTNTAFEDGETMTLRAKGSSVIQKAIGANIDFSNFNANVVSATSAELTKKVSTTASSNDIDLVGTYGISGGGFVTMSGVGIKNTAANAVQIVTAGSTDGSVSTEEAQLIKIGTVIYFTGSTLTVSVANTFTINSHPSANKTIYLNLDNFITPGVSGA